MKNWKKQLSEHQFKLHLVAFLMMVLPPVPMYYAAEQGADAMLGIFLGVIVLANLLVLLVP